MKKIITIASLAFSLCAFNTKAQLADGSIAQDFTFTDLNGNTHNLYSYLNSGKTVFIDISASWCGPCWSFHSSGVWDDLYANHGPLGNTNVLSTTTNDVMVLFFEGDDQTTTGCLYNNSSCNTSYAATQGDWVTGTKYPIISDNTAAINTLNANYGLTYFPTLYMICPDRSTTLLSTTALANGDAYYNLIASTPCQKASASLDAALKNGYPQALISSCDSMNPTIYLTNEGTAPLTSATITYKVNGVTQKTYNWTGNLATYSVGSITGVKLFGNVGTNTITAVVSNPNGGADANAANDATAYTVSNLVMTTSAVATVAEGFQNTFPPTNWGTVNGGDPTYQWTTASVGGMQASTKSAFIDLWDTPDGDVDEMVLQTLDLSTAATASMSFDIAKAAIANQYDRLRVRASTDCGKTWTTVYYKYDNATTNPLQTVMNSNAWTPSAAANWRNDVVSLNAYAGMSNVLLKFQTTSGYSNNLYIDNINLTTTTNSVKSINNITNVSLVPNPASSESSIEVSLANQDNITISVYNTMGQLVISQQHNNVALGDNTFSLNTVDLTNGMYNVVVKTSNGINTQKLAISK